VGGHDGEGHRPLRPADGRFVRHESRPGDRGSLPTDVIHTLFVDAAGGLWVGTHAGLSHLPPDGQAFETFTTRDGLPSDVIYGVRSDHRVGSG